MNQAIQEGASGQHNRASSNGTSIAKNDAVYFGGVTNERRDAALDDCQVFDSLKQSLDRKSVELSVSLRPRSPHGRAFFPIQHTELDAALVGSTTHEAVKGVNFPDQMALAQSAYRGVAGHDANSVPTMRHQCSLGAKSRGSRRGFGSGMAAAYYNYVEISLRHVQKACFT
jgi:hypothetical protein